MTVCVCVCGWQQSASIWNDTEHKYYTLIYALQSHVIYELKQYHYQNVRLIYSFLQRLFTSGGMFNAA